MRDLREKCVIKFMENQAIVTILTPTYNRAHQLPALYKSLCMQSNKCFVWCVVDDGSADNTVEVVNEMIKSDSLMNKDVSLWTDEDFNRALSSPSYRYNQALQNKVKEYIKRR